MGLLILVEALAERVVTRANFDVKLGVDLESRARTGRTNARTVLLRLVGAGRGRKTGIGAAHASCRR